MIKLESVKEIAKFLENRGENLKSLSQDEVQEIEHHFNTTFPEEYRDFLLLMGRSAGQFMKGSSAFIDEIYLLQEGTEELCEENELPKVPQNSFTFWMHQGYQAAYFVISNDPNPPVYYFSEGENFKEFIRYSNSLVEFYVKQLGYFYPEVK